MRRSDEEIIHSLTNQPPKNEHVVQTFEMVRRNAHLFAVDINRYVPEGREKSIALTKLEEAVMWAIKGIALNQEQV